MYLKSIKSFDIEIDFYKSHSNDLDYDINTFANTQQNNWGALEGEYEIDNSLDLYKDSKHWYKLDSITVKSSLSGLRVYK